MVKSMGNKPQVDFLYKLLLISWIYSGVLRNLFPKLSNLLYFSHDLIIVLIFIVHRPVKLFLRNLIAWILISLCVLHLFVYYLFAKIDLVGLIQGLNLYCVGLILFVTFSDRDPIVISLRIKNILTTSLIPNFILALLQVPFKNDFFQKSQIAGTKQIGSADGFIRAYGTFSSSAGFCLYLSVVFAYLIVDINLKKRFSFLVKLTTIISLLIMSQSRTALAIILMQFIIFLKVLSSRNSISSQHTTQTNFKRLLLIILPTIFFLTLYIFPKNIRSFSNRIQQASQNENSVMRIFDQQFSWIFSLNHSLFGDGLASHSIGIVGYQNLNQQWIEMDLVRIVVESGSLLGLLIILFRLCWSLILFASLNRLIKNRQYELAILVPSLAITLLQGPIYGHNDTNTFVWMFLTIFVASRFRSHTQSSNNF